MIPPYQQRVIDEKKALDEKIGLLESFIEGNPIFETLDEDQRYLLIKQYDAMKEYSTILGLRIKKFGVDDDGKN